jgi:hypothetical protein
MRKRLCLIIGAAVLACLATSTLLRADPPAQAAMADAARGQKYCFMLFWKNDDAATRAMRKTLQTHVAARGRQAAWVAVRTTDPAEKAVIDRFGVSRAPLPLVLTVAPNGAITGGFPLKVTEAQLAGAFVSPNMARCLHALQNRKLVLLCVRSPKWAVPAGVSQFQADPQYQPYTAVVSLDPADPDEARHLKDLQVAAGTARVVTVFLAPPGSVIGRFEGSVTKEQIVEKLKAARSNCCPGGKCGPGGCCPDGKCDPRK